MKNQVSSKILSGFARHLSEKHILDEKTALTALQDATDKKIAYIDFLIKQRLLTEVQIATATADYFGLPLCDINAFNIDLIPLQFLNIEFVRRREALPLFIKKGFLYLATSDPTKEGLYQSRFLTGLDLRLLIVESSKLTLVIDNLLNSLILSEMNEARGQVENIKDDTPDEDIAEIASYNVDSAPVVNFVNQILLDAVEKNASDIHFERYEHDFRIRYRINGTLYPIATPPIKLANFIFARVKILSNLDITEHRIPQDGRFKIALSKHKTVDFRVSICPMLFGEKIVLRILDMSQMHLSIDKLGMDPIEKTRLLDALHHSQGIILVTGPTGSGKTVTLYSALNYLNSAEDNISAVEDPVEITLHGVNQVHVNPKVGLTFANALRSFLRQDPDIIMVGEIRDLETAEIAIKAAQTGHLVLSTVHTNSASETIGRLMNMGVAPYNLASVLILVVAQRLLRVLCNHCKIEEELPKETLKAEGFDEKEIGSFVVYKAVGCNRCMHGYTGRTGIFEVLPISQEMVLLILKEGNAVEIADLAQKEQVINLRQAGLKKVKLGETSLTELNRVFK